MSVTNDIVFVTEIPLPNHDGIKDRHAALCFFANAGWIESRKSSATTFS